MVTLGEIVRWFVYTVDAIYRRISARLLRRDRLVASSERKFRALLESAPDAIVIVDDHGHIALVNTQAERMFGWSRAEIAGQSINELIPNRYRGRHREHVKSYLRDAHARSMGTGLELYGRRKNGSEFPVEISLSPLATDQGLLVSAAIRDISERKALEREVLETRAALERRILSQRQALEINDNIIQGLVLAKYALERGDHDQNTEALESTLRHAQKIVSDLLEESGVEPGQLRRQAPARLQGD